MLIRSPIGNEYHDRDFVYILADVKDGKKEDGTKGAQAHWSGAQPVFRLAQVLKLDVDDEDDNSFVHDGDDEIDGAKKSKLRPSTKILVQPFIRLGHIVRTEKRQERDLVATKETALVRVDKLFGKFTLNFGTAPSDLPSYVEPDVFYAKSVLPESQDKATEKAVLSAWSRPPPLLEPHSGLSVDLKPLIEPLRKPSWKTCKKCDEETVEEAKKDVEYRQLMVDARYRLKGLSLYAGLDLLAEGVGRTLCVSPTFLSLLSLSINCSSLLSLSVLSRTTDTDTTPLHSPVKFDTAIEMDEYAAKACRCVHTFPSHPVRQRSTSLPCHRINHPDTNVIVSSVGKAYEEAYFAPNGAEKQTFDADIVVGGPPCQSFVSLSSLSSDSRSTLLTFLPSYSFSRANRHQTKDDLRTLEPFVFLNYFVDGRPLFGIMENVAALATHAHESGGDVYGLVLDVWIRLGQVDVFSLLPPESS
jgi:hypothetical protein